jgi:ribosomal protein S18 acetylase RimI-like enzyme
MSPAARITIRPATPDDAEALAPLLAVLGYPVGPALLAERLGRLAIADPTGATLVACRGEALLGFATLHATPVLHRPTAVGRITGIAVADEARGRGVGRLLVAAAERFFAEQGIGRLEITSGPTHQAAHDFYRHLGYEDMGVRFAKPLAPAPARA